MSLQIIPARFVKQYVTEEYLNSRTAVVFSPLGKFWQIELENSPSGMFFAGGWSQFLDFHGISKGDILLLRYEGNMVFKVKAFGLNGHQKDFKNQDAGILQSEKMNLFFYYIESIDRYQHMLMHFVFLLIDRY